METEYFFKTENLVIWQPKSVLDSSKIINFINFLDENSRKRDPHFNRFIDLTKISGISVNYQNLLPIAQARRTYYDSNLTRKVKMGFLVDNPLAFGMARMYQSLSDDKHMDVTISENPEELVDFLNVDRSELGI